ncbi:hypothetical protein M3Y97_00163100 [Aphelenchoides bicaudatus]|nr:hypothetical protein M3Y97_00163100 [Aphelenchoides bicaudatus]
MSVEVEPSELLSENGDVVANLIESELAVNNEPQVVVLLPLVKEPNRSLTRLYRTNPSTITNSTTFVGTYKYRDLFILEKAEEDDISNTDKKGSQIFTHVFNGFDGNNVQKLKEARTFYFVYQSLIPQIAQERLAKEFMAELQIRCTELSFKSALNLNGEQDHLRASPVNILLQTMIVLREFEYSDHLQYIDIEVEQLEIPAKQNFKFWEANNGVPLPSSNRRTSHVQRCRITGNSHLF